MLTAQEANKISLEFTDREFDTALHGIANVIHMYAESGRFSVGFTNLDDFNGRIITFLEGLGYIITKGEFTRFENNPDKKLEGFIINW